jgi:hypothetical protein
VLGHELNEEVLQLRRLPHRFIDKRVVRDRLGPPHVVNPDDQGLVGLDAPLRAEVEQHEADRDQ